MTDNTFFSIDQNSHALWDTVPKLAALVRHGWRGTHFIEDVDVAFTRHGATLGDRSLSLMPERYYRGGTSDWGATLFYADFLGRQPLDVACLERYTGWSTAALSRRLNLTVDELYDRYSLSDYRQLVGASYADDIHHHRTIGDLGVKEIAPYLLDLLEYARNNTKASFPDRAARARTAAWFEVESALLERLLDTLADAPLVELYRRWLRERVDTTAVRVSLTSNMLDSDRPDMPQHELLDMFVSNYELFANLYNEAIEEAAVALKPLDTVNGELPFFVIMRRNGRLVRTSAALRNRCLLAGELSWPIAEGPTALPLRAMREAGVVCVVGKALLLVLHARFKPKGNPLVLPYKGSLYMSAAHLFEAKLSAAGLLPRETYPVFRVKLNFIERMCHLQTRIRLPEYLHRAFGVAEMPAAQFAEQCPCLIAEARQNLDTAATEQGRQRLSVRLFPQETRRRREMAEERARLGRNHETRSQASALWDEIKEIDRRLLQRLVDWTVLQLQLTDLEFANSRGALLPWSIALGGEQFYEDLLEHAEIYQEVPSNP